MYEFILPYLKNHATKQTETAQTKLVGKFPFGRGIKLHKKRKASRKNTRRFVREAVGCLLTPVVQGTVRGKTSGLSCRPAQREHLVANNCFVILCPEVGFLSSNERRSEEHTSELQSQF